MFMKPLNVAETRVAGLLAAAEAAARAIPPAFPLSATVAVNPFLGQSGEDLATASARLTRVAGVRLTRPRSEYAAAIRAGVVTDDDLAASLAACAAPNRPSDLAALKAALTGDRPAPLALPTVADLAADATGVDWPAVITRCFGLWASGHFDRGQALWPPAPGRGAFAAWRDWATHDLTPEIAGLAGFCAHVSGAPDTAERAIVRAAERLALGERAAETAFHRLLMDLGGWAQHARWLLWQAELAGGTDHTLTDLLAIRLVFEEALLAHAPAVTAGWSAVMRAHAAPVVATDEDVMDAVLQDATERAHQRRLHEVLPGARRQGAARSAMQAAFCIDVRSEVYRRALEALDPSIETIGFAGFFGLPIAHRAHGTDEAEAHLPVLLRPALFSCSHAEPEHEQATRIAARATRAFGRFRQAAVSSFVFVESAGPGYAWKLVRDGLGLQADAPTASPAPRLAAATAETRVATAVAVLKAMSLTQGFARLVLLVGHGARVTNNPFASAYHCGACGGQTGEVSARLLAQLLNDPATRLGLAERGIAIPEDTLFVAGLHETTTDRVELFLDAPAPHHADDIAAARRRLEQASAVTRAERSLRFAGESSRTIAARATNWAEIRPEWGLAGCAAFIAAPRAVTAAADLNGRAFLHSYDWRADAGFATLELILTAPVLVASWISLQYFGSAVAPDAFGGGNKLIHNVVGGIGVVEGNGGRLRPGLPRQAIHDGETLVHEPLRLSVLIDAPRDAIAAILKRHPAVRELFDHGWLHLFALQDGRMRARYREGLAWEEV